MWMKKKKTWIIAFVSVCTGVLLLDLIAGFYFYHLVIERGEKDFLQGNADLEVNEETMDEFTEGEWIDWTEKQDFTSLSVTSFDNLELQGYYLPQDEPTNKTVIFAHGYLGNAFDMGLFGEYYYEELGYNIFSPDLRGHGSSEGDFYGFGWPDRKDLLRWIDEIIAINGPDTEIVLHGLSMGGAAVVMTSGEELPDNVKAVVADSAYTSVYDLFTYQLQRMYHVPDKPILPTLSAIMQYRANYGLKEASALHAAQKTDLPILYIAGEEDTFVPFTMTKELYQQTENAELATFSGANHGESIVMHRDDYLETLTTYVNKHIDDES